MSEQIRNLMGGVVDVKLVATRMTAVSTQRTKHSAKWLDAVATLFDVTLFIGCREQYGVNSLLELLTHLRPSSIRSYVSVGTSSSPLTKYAMAIAPEGTISSRTSA
ncbi:hypothetical protein O9993_11970 [Vibrio lentus]|nr:hypothetical protein [Vibrio lentus]